MTKKHLVIVVYIIYVLFLFIITSYYKYLDELPSSEKAFFITSVSSTLILLWFFGDLFKERRPIKYLQRDVWVSQ